MPKIESNFCKHFKISFQILSLCIRMAPSNVEQCDIEHINWLLTRETASVAAEMRPDFVNSTYSVSFFLHVRGRHILISMWVAECTLVIRAL